MNAEQVVGTRDIDVFWSGDLSAFDNFKAVAIDRNEVSSQCEVSGSERNCFIQKLDINERYNVTLHGCIGTSCRRQGNQVSIRVGMEV